MNNLFESNDTIEVDDNWHFMEPHSVIEWKEDSIIFPPPLEFDEIKFQEQESLLRTPDKEEYWIKLIELIIKEENSTFLQDIVNKCLQRFPMRSLLFKKIINMLWNVSEETFVFLKSLFLRYTLISPNTDVILSLIEYYVATELKLNLVRVRDDLNEQGLKEEYDRSYFIEVELSVYERLKKFVVFFVSIVKHDYMNFGDFLKNLFKLLDTLDIANSNEDQEVEFFRGLKLKILVLASEQPFRDSYRISSKFSDASTALIEEKFKSKIECGKIMDSLYRPLFISKLEEREDCFNDLLGYELTNPSELRKEDFIRRIDLIFRLEILQDANNLVLWFKFAKQFLTPKLGTIEHIHTQKILIEAIKMNPETTFLYLYFVEILEQREMFAECKYVFESLLKLQPGNKYVTCNFLRFAFQHANNRELLCIFMKLMQNHRSKELVLTYVDLVRANNPKQCLNILLQYLLDYINDEIYLNEYLHSLTLCESVEIARTGFQKALTLNPNENSYVLIRDTWLDFERNRGDSVSQANVESIFFEQNCSDLVLLNQKFGVRNEFLIEPSKIGDLSVLKPEITPEQDWNKDALLRKMHSRWSRYFLPVKHDFRCIFIPNNIYNRMFIERNDSSVVNTIFDENRRKNTVSLKKEPFIKEETNVENNESNMET
eukprot:TRINITY_DN2259_c0_g1_i1.p1 TRINITY_DN2259_c0_g1~~TRINITY_DN2259_c0_g1_i1.p1  ORF type:complete len:659 (+),score=168.94 TRINITY_DN2259_c0_g1_i1:45-2021(+)